MNIKSLSIKAISYISLAVVVAAAAGCASTPRFHERVEFVEAEYLPFKADGAAVVSGKIDWKLLGTNPYLVAKDVWLNPVTSYSKQWYEISYWSGWNIGPADSRQVKYLRRAEVNGNDFSVKNVPPGDYYLTGRITWATDNGGDNEGTRRIWIVKKIHINEGADQKLVGVELTKPRGSENVGAWMLDNELGTNPPAAVK